MTELDHLLLDRRLEALLAPWHAGPGITVGVVQGGELTHHRHAGLANIEHSVPIDVPAMREGGRAIALMASGGRVKTVRYLPSRSMVSL